VEKLVVADTISWKERFLVLTKSALFLAHDDNAATALDAIPLREIETVLHTNPEASGVKSHRRTQSMRGSLAQLHEQDDADTRHTEACFFVRTTQNGYNSGRTYQLCTSSPAECKNWVLEIENQAKVAKNEYEDALKPGLIDKCRRSLRTFSSTNQWQFFVSSVIILSFIVSVIELDYSEPCLDNPGEDCPPAVFMWLDYAFTIMFCIDLLTCMFVDWFWEWARDGWNLFDFFVVGASLASDLVPATPSLDVLRLFRVFRIVRVFKRFKGLRAIINSLTSSIVPVTQSLSVLGVVSSIYSVLGVKLFKTTDPENFGNFGLSILSVLSITTGEGWEIGRGLFFVQKINEDGTIVHQVLFWNALYFCSFLLLSSVILLNVVMIFFDLYGKCFSILFFPSNSDEYCRSYWFFATFFIGSNLPVCGIINYFLSQIRSWQYS